MSETESFVEWSRHVSEKAGPLEKTIDQYREEEIQERSN